MRSLIRKIKRTAPSDDSFMAKVTVLKEIIEHHIEEEEEEYFPECKTELGEEKLQEMGEKLQAAHEKLEAKSAPRAMKKAA